jgi:hypothetical protein
MWMGFADQQVAGSGPAAITTFQGNTSASFTSTTSGDYFYDGSIQHLSHVILDLKQFYASTEPYTERCQYRFRSDPMPATGYKDQFKDGGGPALSHCLSLWGRAGKQCRWDWPERLELYNHLQLSCFREALRNSGIKRCLYVLSMVEYSKYDADC